MLLTLAKIRFSLRLSYFAKLCEQQIRFNPQFMQGNRETKQGFTWVLLHTGLKVGFQLGFHGHH